MYDELDYLSPQILNDVESKIVSQQQKYLLPIENTPKNWVDNEFVYVDDIKTIEDKIDDMRKFFDITAIPKRDWNLEGVNNISYVDINRWLKNLETLGEIKLKLTQLSNNPLNIVNSVGLSLRNYVCYGNSYQEATPTPINQIEIQTISGEIELKNIGKNLFDKSNINADKGVATSTGGLYTSTTTFATTYIEIKKGDYVVNAYSSTVNRVYGAVYNDKKQYLGEISTSVGVKTFTITYENAKYIRLTCLNEYLDTYQIEKGTTATEYEPYKEFISTINLGDNELVKIDDVSDKLNVDELGNITITKNIGKVVLNGSENWQEFYMTKTNTNVFSINSTYLNNNYQNSYNKITALSDYFKCYGLGTLYGNDDIEAIELNSNTSYSILIGISKDIASSVSEFKQWLSENNVIVYYQLATPTTIELGNINIPILQGNSYLYTNANLEPTNISCKYLEYDGNYKPLLPSSNLYPSNTLLPTNNKGE